MIPTAEFPDKLLIIILVRWRFGEINRVADSDTTDVGIIYHALCRYKVKSEAVLLSKLNILIDGSSETAR